MDTAGNARGQGVETSHEVISYKIGKLYEIAQFIHRKKYAIRSQEMPDKICNEIRKRFNVKWSDSQLKKLWHDMAPQL
jgi:hypothetical protein